MLSNLKRYHRPKAIPEALALLQKNSGSVLIIAGGTKLVATENNVVEELIDITGLELNFVKDEEGTLRIGATTTLQSIVEHPLIKTFANGILADAALLANSSRMIRNMSTLGGELITTTPLSVLYCSLLVLQAQIRIAGGEEFALAVNIFLNKKNIAGGLIVEVLIPALKPNTFAAMIPIHSRKQNQPIMCACARMTLQNGVCSSVKIALTGSARVPQRLHEVEAMLEGNVPDEKNLVEAKGMTYDIYKPIPDRHASSEFRHEMSGVLVKRALQACLDKAELSE